MMADAEKKKTSSAAWLLRLLARQWPPFACSAGLLIFHMFLELSIPELCGRAVDDLAPGPERGALLGTYALILAGVILVRGAVEGAQLFFQGMTVQNVIAEVRLRLFEAIQRLPFPFFDRTHIGQLIARSTRDLTRVRVFFGQVIFNGLRIVITLGGAIVYLLLINPTLALLALAMAPPAMLLVAVFAGEVRRRWGAASAAYGDVTTVVHENVTGVRVVKSFAREEAEVGKYTDRAYAYQGKYLSAVSYWGSRMPLGQFVFGLNVTVILMAGGWLYQQGAVQLGDMVRFFTLLTLVGMRFNALGQLVNGFQSARAAADRVREVMDQVDEDEEDGHRELPPGGGALRLEAVTFNYPGRPPEQPVLENIDLDIKPGEFVALVGRTGSGKSTLVSLLPRFYEVNAGRILLDGVDIREIRRQDLRRAIGTVFQETFLFSATVAENIAYGLPEVSREQVEAAARAAGADGFIRELENGYDTVVGERGVTLSGGQCQRLAIARALLIDPRLLIMDDATSSVDAETERLIREALERVAQNRTTIVIAHRLSTVRRASRIIVLEGGRVVEQGRHEELVGRDGPYRKIYRIQFAGQERQR